MANYACMLKLEGAGGMALQRLAAEGLAWVPTLGNLLTMSAVALGVALNGFLTGGSPEAIFMLAPILLLLAQDPLLFPGLSDRQRYCPPAAAVSAFLLATGAAVAVSDVATGRGDAARSGLPGWMYLAKEIGMARECREGMVQGGREKGVGSEHAAGRWEQLRGGRMG